MCEDCLEWRSCVSHGIVKQLGADLFAGPAGAGRLATVPSCKIEVWARGPDARGRDVELAFCKGTVRYGNPQAQLIWLGSRGSQPVHQSVQGKLCTTDAAGRPQTLAQALCGLFAEISSRFGAWTVDLIADDSGSGRLVEYYANLGFEKGTHVHGAVWRMSAPIHRIAQLAPACWVAGFVPQMNGERWLTQAMPLSSPPQSKQSILSPTDYDPAVRPRTTPAKLLRRMRHARVPAPQSAEYQISSVQKPDVHPSGHSKRQASPEIAQTKQSILNSDLRPSAVPQLAKSTTEEPKKEDAPCAMGPQEVLLLKKAAKPFQICRKGSKPKLTQISFEARVPSPREVVVQRPATVHAIRSVPSAALVPLPKVGRWSWNVEWPLHARADVRVQTSRDGKRYRIDAWLRGSTGSELAYCRGAIPPSKGFLQVLWLGRQHGQPVDPSVRGQRVYKTEQATLKSVADFNVTTAVALLGVAAALGCWLEVSSAEIEPLDEGSGRLVEYLSALGFQGQSGADHSPSLREHVDGHHRLTTSCEALRRRCLPVAWQEELPPSTALPLLRPALVGAGQEAE